MSRLDAAAELVAISSVSGTESALAALVESRLRENPALEVERIGDTVVARTTGHHATRLIVAGHLDTVPGDAAHARIDGDTLWGLGACDMKGSLSVMLELAADEGPRSHEVTWVFYAREEVARNQSGLLEVAELRPDLLVGDAALLAEPTGGAVEAGCQGTLRVIVTMAGERAHTARPWRGRNAIHRLGAVIARVAAYQPRHAVVDGVTYTEQLQAVGLAGGVAANVVPDVARVTLNHRVAPDRTTDQAEAWLRDYLGDLIEDGDSVEVADAAPPAPPALRDPHLARLVTAAGSAVRAKAGWTDVAYFYERGVPATNFGAGDPELAHHRDERVTLSELDRFAEVLGEWLA